MRLNAAEARADEIIALLASGEDPGAARSEEDEFLREVLRAISSYMTDRYCRSLVAQALRVVNAPGERW